MFKKNNVNFSIFEKNNINYVSMESTVDSITSNKTILLDDFLKFVTDFDQNKSVTDSGFLTPNLIRKVTKGTKEICFYHLPSIIVNPQCSIEDINIGSSALNLFFSEREGVDFKYTIEDHVESRRNRRYKKLVLNNLNIRNIIICTYFDYANSGNLISYNIFHSLTPDSLFQDSSIITEDTLLFPSIMPNHYADHICWGSTGYEDRLRTFIREKDYENVKSLPYVYYNSMFNDDLLSSSYSYMNHYKIPKELFLEIVTYYHNNLKDKTKTFEDFKSSFINAFTTSSSRNDNNTEYSILSSITHFMVFLAPIFSEPDFYKRYFESILKLNETSEYPVTIHTISSFINSRFTQ